MSRDYVKYVHTDSWMNTHDEIEIIGLNFDQLSVFTCIAVNW